MPIRWIISDVDGCLTDEASEPFHLASLQALTHWARRSAAGTDGLPRLTLCTGRPQPYVEALAKLFDIRAPLICENGAVIYTLADNRARFLPAATADRRLALWKLEETLLEEVLPRFPDAVLQFGKMAHLSIFSRRTEILEILAPLVEDHARALGLAVEVKPSRCYLNVSLEGVSKGAAIAEIVRELGASREELAGIGDTEGDLSIRDAVGFFACPSNARPALKAKADYVASRPMAEGVLEILAHIESLSSAS